MEPDEENPRVPVMAWNACAFTIISTGKIINGYLAYTATNKVESWWMCIVGTRSCVGENHIQPNKCTCSYQGSHKL